MQNQLIIDTPQYQSMFSRRWRAIIRLWIQRSYRYLGLGFRSLICFLVAATVLIVSRNGDYDARFSLRGNQDVGDQIVLLTLKRSDIEWISGVETTNSKNVLWSLKEVVESSDAYFWQPQIWEKAYRYLFQKKAQVVVNTLFFGEEAVRGTITPVQDELFRNRSSYWVAKTTAAKRVLLPGFATKSGNNTGTLNILPDHDGAARHYVKEDQKFPHLAFRVANYILASKGKPPLQEDSFDSRTINFMGGPGTFKSISFESFMRGEQSLNLEGKTVIIGLSDVSSHLIQTPVGVMSQSELVANLTFAFLENKWISEIPLGLGLIYIIFVIALAVFIISSYPQPIAVFFLGATTVGVVVLSTALFDIYAIWIPIVAPVSGIIAAYFVIFSYRLVESERQSWQSEKELHYLAEVEGLKNNFLSLISHDLKNPIAKIQGVVDSLLSQSPEDKSHYLEGLKRIKQTSEELRQYIGSIINVTRVEARNIKLTRDVCDLNLIIETAIDRLKPIADQKSITILKDLEPLFSMELDRPLILEVLINLIENAIKYSKPGSQVVVSSLEKGDEVQVEIIDQGEGIKPEELSKVFDKFYRGEGEKTLRESGSGLGLYLVKYFIELHGGKVFIRSEVGVGTRVGFTLPLDDSKEA